MFWCQLQSRPSNYFRMSILTKLSGRTIPSRLRLFSFVLDSLFCFATESSPLIWLLLLLIILFTNRSNLTRVSVDFFLGALLRTHARRVDDMVSGRPWKCMAHLLWPWGSRVAIPSACSWGSLRGEVKPFKSQQMKGLATHSYQHVNIKMGLTLPRTDTSVNHAYHGWRFPSSVKELKLHKFTMVVRPLH